MVLPDSLRFSAQSLCLMYFSIVASRDVFIYALAVALVVLFASLRVWFETWWEVAYGITLGTVFALLSVFVFALQSFTPLVQKPIERILYVSRLNRNLSFSIELVLLALVFMLIDHEITETRYPIGVTVTFVLLCVWFLFIGFAHRLDSIMWRSYLFLIVSMTTILFAHVKIYTSIYAVSAAACTGALLIWSGIWKLWK